MTNTDKKAETKKSGDELKCDDCGVIFNSASQKDQHMQGKKHAAVMVEKKSIAPEKTPTPVNKDHFCHVCNIALNSEGQAKQHFSGMRHQVAAGVVPQTPQWWLEQQMAFNATNTKRSSGNGIGETYRCDVCKIDLNSAFQYNSHMNGVRHKETVEKQAKDKETKAGVKRGRGRGFPRGHFVPPFLGNRPPFPGHMPFYGGHPPMMGEPWFEGGFGPIMRPSFGPMHPMGFRPYPMSGRGRARGRGRGRGSR